MSLPLNIPTDFPYFYRVKSISAILAVFLMVLILVPCSDTLAGDQCGKETHFHEQGDHDDHYDLDLCSPFCSCSCCGSTYVVKAKFFNSGCYSSLQSLNVMCATEPCKEYIHKVFQPPKA